MYAANPPRADRHAPSSPGCGQPSATAPFGLQTYTHVIPGMDDEAADVVADLLAPPSPGVVVSEADGTIRGASTDDKGSE